MCVLQCAEVVEMGCEEAGHEAGGCEGEVGECVGQSVEKGCDYAGEGVRGEGLGEEVAV